MPEQQGVAEDDTEDAHDDADPPLGYPVIHVGVVVRHGGVCLAPRGPLATRTPGGAGGGRGDRRRGDGRPDSRTRSRAARRCVIPDCHAPFGRVDRILASVRGLVLRPWVRHGGLDRIRLGVVRRRRISPRIATHRSPPQQCEPRRLAHDACHSDDRGQPAACHLLDAIPLRSQRIRQSADIPVPRRSIDPHPLYRRPGVLHLDSQRRRVASRLIRRTDRLRALLHQGRTAAGQRTHHHHRADCRDDSAGHDDDGFEEGGLGSHRSASIACPVIMRRARRAGTSPRRRLRRSMRPWLR
jgi:hypothetical protein